MLFCRNFGRIFHASIIRFADVVQIIAWPNFKQAFSYGADGFTFSSRIQKYTEAFMVNSITAGFPGAVATKSSLLHKGWAWVVSLSRLTLSNNSFSITLVYVFHHWHCVKTHLNAEMTAFIEFCTPADDQHIKALWLAASGCSLHLMLKTYCSMLRPTTIRWFLLWLYRK